MPADSADHPLQHFSAQNEKWKTYLEGPEETGLQIFGDHNLQNISAAYLACKELGIDDHSFLKAIASYKGAAKRLQKITENPGSVAYLDFAHSPSKLKATIEAVRQQYPDKKLLACMELHTFSSLNADFLPQYKGCMASADQAVVFQSGSCTSQKITGNHNKRCKKRIRRRKTGSVHR